MNGRVELMVSSKGPKVELRLRHDDDSIADEVILLPRELMLQLIDDLQNPALNQGWGS